MKLFVLAVSSLVGFQLFAQEPSLNLYSETPNLHQEIENNLNHAFSSLQKTHALIASSVHAESFLKTKIPMPYVHSVVTKNTNISIDQFLIDYSSGIAVEDIVESNLISLSKEDPYNWYPTYIKYINKLEDVSKQLAECDEFSCDQENYQERLNTVLHFLNRLIFMINSIDENEHLQQSAPTLSYGFEDAYYVMRSSWF